MYFKGRNIIQGHSLRGYGFGSVFSGWLRSNILPLLKSGAKYVGKQLLTGSVGAAGDILSGSKKPREAIRSRMQQVGKDIFATASSKLRGEGGRGKRKKKCKRLLAKKKKKNH